MTSNETKPALKGLVLAGGRSTRMGEDKSRINWNGKEQRYYVADLLRECCDEVFISCRPEQQAEIDTQYTTLPDSVIDGGPSGGILTAFAAQPDSAWLVVACDLPLIDSKTLQYLISQRDTNFIATTFQSPHDGLPEPLITIWEPSARTVLQALQEEGLKCPRKALIRNAARVNILQPPHADALINANTPEDAKRVTEILLHKNIAS